VVEGAYEQRENRVNPRGVEGCTRLGTPFDSARADRVLPVFARDVEVFVRHFAPGMCIPTDTVETRTKREHSWCGESLSVIAQ